MRNFRWLALVALFVTAQPARAQTVVQSQKNALQNATTISRAFISNVGAHHWIGVIVGSWNPAATAPTINTPTDALALTYTLAPNCDTTLLVSATSASRARMYFAEDTGASGGADTVTVTVSGTTPDIDLIIVEVSGLLTSGSRDQSNATSAQGVSSLATPTVTTTQANEYIFTYAYDQSNAVTFTASAGYTIEQNTSNPDLESAVLADRMVSAAGNYLDTFGGFTTDNVHAGIATFKAAAGGAAPPKRLPVLGVGG